MITARKHRMAELLLDRYNRYLLRRHFHALHFRGAGHGAGLDRTRPMVFYGNHSSWWDGLVTYMLSREHLALDGYWMMEERQLARYGFFRRTGAFSVNRGSSVGANRALEYARALFVRPNRALWMFPQGMIRSNDTRPLEFERGISVLASRLGDAQLVPVALRYEFLGDQRPEIFVQLGVPIQSAEFRDQAHLLVELEHRLTDLLDDVRCAVMEGRFDMSTTILRGRQSTNTVLDRVLGRERS